jgi:hypothetical protein
MLKEIQSMLCSFQLHDLKNRSQVKSSQSNPTSRGPFVLEEGNDEYLQIRWVRPMIEQQS